jgi:hypothetical protein
MMVIMMSVDDGLGCCTMLSYGCMPTFWRNILAEVRNVGKWMVYIASRE